MLNMTRVDAHVLPTKTDGVITGVPKIFISDISVTLFGTFGYKKKIKFVLIPKQFFLVENKTPE